MRISEENEHSFGQKNCKSPSSSGTQKTHYSLEAGFKFPKTARLLSKVQYKRVFHQGKRVFGQTIAINYRRGNSLCPKLGITISKRFGKAHERNRFKRVVREAFRVYSSFLPSDLEINVLPRIERDKWTKSAILLDFKRLLHDL